MLRSEETGRSKGSRLKGWIEKPERFALTSRLLLGCAFTESESREIDDTVSVQVAGRFRPNGCYRPARQLVQRRDMSGVGAKPEAADVRSKRRG